MSQENVEILRRGYDLMWREGKIEEALEMADPGIEWITPGSPLGRIRYGRGAVARFFREWLEIFEAKEVRYEFTDAGDKVVVSSHFRGLARGSGIETEMGLGQVWTMRDGAAVRCEHF